MYRLISCRSPVFYVFFNLMPGLLPRVSAAAFGATRGLVADVVEAGWSLRGTAAAGRSLGYSDGSLLTLTSHWTDNGDHLGLPALPPPLPTMTDAPLCHAAVR